jgi:ABC-type glutathione transport system ATPase component
LTLSVLPYFSNFWGSSFVIFAGQFLIYGGFTLLFEEYTQLRLKRQSQQNNIPRDEDEDDDVAKERDVVDSANATDREKNLVWVRGLRKEFNAKKKIHKVAVHNFSLHIPRGESFGLLGANGAGKQRKNHDQFRETFWVLIGELSQAKQPR